MGALTTALRLSLGMLWMAVAAPLQALLLLPFLPSRAIRVKLCHYWGWLTGSAMMRLAGCPVTTLGGEHLDPNRPAIYIMNHTSTLDVFLGIWHAPVGAVGVAKKEVAWNPFFGQLYLLSGHLLVDRGHHSKAVAAMRDLAETVRRYRMGIWIWPEGTRSKDGRLMPLKKGIYHLAVETGLPIVPVACEGAFDAWPSTRWEIRPSPVTMRVLPPIDTSSWASRPAEACLAEAQAALAAGLPERMRPLAG